VVNRWMTETDPWPTRHSVKKEVVLASDYDALAARLAEAERRLVTAITRCADCGENYPQRCVPCLLDEDFLKATADSAVELLGSVGGPLE
jgi:hypothetical protein